MNSLVDMTGKKHRRQTEKPSEKASENHRSKNQAALNETQQRILELLSRNAQLSASKMAEQIGISSRNIESNINSLKKKGILARLGSPKPAYWEIVE